MTGEAVLALRAALAALPRAPNHRPGEPVDASAVYTVSSHRAALDPERPLVIGNRGMGKSFWAHALLNQEVRIRIARTYSFPSLDRTQVVFGFNGSERADSIAPTPDVLESAAAGAQPLDLWRAVLLRAAASHIHEVLPERFIAQVAFVTANPERCAQLLTAADDSLLKSGEQMLILFDALDRVAPDWPTTQLRIRGLLQLALRSQSFRALRLKLFLRSDQFLDSHLFAFQDASKIRNSAVDLSWPSADLYRLLFHHLRACEAFTQLPAAPQSMVEALAGEFMGAGEKRGRVYSWLPTHLADARGEISPRTFLTVWREAARGGRGSATPVNHLDIQEGVRRASADRLQELAEDYPFVRDALAPLRGKEVPLERTALHNCWREADTVQQVRQRSQVTGRQVHLPLDSNMPEDALLDALKAIGVLEVRQNGKVNVPDIFRVEAGIKRRGGVKPPRRSHQA